MLLICYAIDIIEGGGNSGYVLLDTNCPELITTFCFNSGALGPYQKQMSMLKKTLNSSSLGAPCLLQLSPLDLFPYDEAVGIAINTDGVPFKPRQRVTSVIIGLLQKGKLKRIRENMLVQLLPFILSQV